MLGVSAHMPDAAAESGGASGGSSEAGGVPVGGVTEDSGGGGGGGANRWPRQETLALLRIRSDMDVAFRDSSLKGPLWDEVSRKMTELGFHRSAKKCKEKFENVYKYHKRTKDGRASKSDGKNYRFFDQLEALENAPPPSYAPPPPRPMVAPPMPANTASLPMPPSHHHPTVSSSSPNPLSVAPPVLNPPMHSSPFQPSPPPPLAAPPPNQTFQAFQAMNSNSTSSSSTSSDEDIQMRRGKKRKWKEFFHRLMKDVIHKQEDLQKKFLETLEKRERDRMAREEAWRVQEMARMNREHELLVQERSIAAAKDAAVVAFLQKVTDQNSIQIPVISTGNNNAAPVQPPENHPRQPPPQPNMSVSLTPPPPPPKPMTAAPVMTVAVTPPKTDSGGDRDNNSNSASSSRWPKAEVQALIDLRTSLDLKYLESGPKGPLWEEISAAMAKLGYNRSSKRCKEKWENINKYFKKVKESNKKRPEDSKTCPYFHQLEAIYKERAKIDHSPSFSQGYNTTINPENPMAPIMARPEQQWPLPDQAMRDRDHDNESDEEDEEEEDDEGGGGGFEIVANKQPSSAANAAE